jgi:hypothetical protein
LPVASKDQESFSGISTSFAKAGLGRRIHDTRYTHEFFFPSSLFGYHFSAIAVLLLSLATEQTIGASKYMPAGAAVPHDSPFLFLPFDRLSYANHCVYCLGMT